MLAKEEQIKAANERCETGAGRGRVCEQKERRREREKEVCLRSTKLSLSLSLFLLLNPGHLVPLLYRLLIFTKSTHQVPSQ
jgi:hypothetical protein